MLGSEQRGAIARDRRLRAQDIHRLGAGDPRHPLERERGDPPLREERRQVVTPKRGEQPDDQRSGA